MRAGGAAVTPARRDRATPATSSLRVAIGLAGVQFGGCQINAIDLARTLRERGHEVSVFAFRDDSVRQTILPYAQESGFAVELLPSGDGLIQAARRISQFTDAHRSDIVHVFAPWLNAPVAVASASWRDRVGIETNWNMTNYFWGSGRIPLIVGTGRMLDEARDVRAAAVHLMEPPVDEGLDHPDEAAGARFRADHGIDDDDTLVVIVTRVDKAMKGEGIHTTISAVEQIADPALRLVIVGDGDAFAEVGDRIRAVNARLGHPAVTAVGALQDPRPAYAGADIVVGMGGAAIRGLAHAKPLVVLGRNGFSAIYAPENLEHFRSEGFFGDGCAGDPADQLASLIEQLRNDPARRGGLARFGLTEVSARFGLDAATNQLEDVYLQARDHAPARTVRMLEAVRLIARAGFGRVRAAVRRRRR